MNNESIEDIQARRAARKAELAKQCEAQRAVDLAALDAAEVEHGDSNIAYVNVPFTPGLPTLAVVRTPSDPEQKRYRDTVKPKKLDGTFGDTTQAAKQLARAALVYPDPDVYAAQCAARPGLPTQLGLAALKLADAQEAEESKD